MIADRVTKCARYPSLSRVSINSAQTRKPSCSRKGETCRSCLQSLGMPSPGPVDFLEERWNCLDGRFREGTAEAGREMPPAYCFFPLSAVRISRGRRAL